MDNSNSNSRKWVEDVYPSLNMHDMALLNNQVKLPEQTKTEITDPVTTDDQTASAFKLPPPETALEILENSSCLSTGCAVLDKILQGGLLTGTISEVTGESGAGKTQLCLQLAFTAQLSCDQGGLESGALYICTEDAFPIKRLQQMMEEWESRDCSSGSGGSCSSKDSGSSRDISLPHGRRLSDGVFIEHCSDLPALRVCLERKLPALLQAGLVRLIVLDSVTALFSGTESSQQDMGQLLQNRAAEITSLAARLNALAAEHQLVIVVVNQVRDRVTDHNGCQSNSEGSSEPALGLLWANQVATRLQLSRSDFQHPDGTVRRLTVRLAPHLPPSSIYFLVTPAGLRAIA